MHPKELKIIWVKDILSHKWSTRNGVKMAAAESKIHGVISRSDPWQWELISKALHVRQVSINFSWLQSQGTVFTSENFVWRDVTHMTICKIIMWEACLYVPWVIMSCCGSLSFWSHFPFEVEEMEFQEKVRIF